MLPLELEELILDFIGTDWRWIVYEGKWFKVPAKMNVTTLGDILKLYPLAHTNKLHNICKHKVIVHKYETLAILELD